MPPEKLNLLSVEGFQFLFPDEHWEVCELSTPGIFDVDVVKRHIETLPDDDRWHRFMKYLLLNREENARAAFQEFLQTYQLSSFLRLTLRKIISKS